MGSLDKSLVGSLDKTSAVIATGTVNIGTNLLIFDTLSLKKQSTNLLGLFSAGGIDVRDIALRSIEMQGNITSLADGGALATYPNANWYYMFKAMDTGVDNVEVARLQGAADPYFQATLPMRLLPGAVPGAPLEGHFWYDSATHKLMYYDNVGAKTVAV